MKRKERKRFLGVTITDNVITVCELLSCANQRAWKCLDGVPARKLNRKE